MSMLNNFRVLLTKNQTITFVINGSFFLAAITPNSGNRLVNNKSAQNIEQEILKKSASWVSFTISGSNRKCQSWPKDPSQKGNQDDTWWGDGMWYAQRGFYPSPRAASASGNNLFPRNLIGKSSSQTAECLHQSYHAQLAKNLHEDQEPWGLHSQRTQLMTTKAKVVQHGHCKVLSISVSGDRQQVLLHNPIMFNPSKEIGYYLWKQALLQ